LYWQITNIPAPCPLAQKGGKTNKMKYLAIIALAAVALSLGACASKEPTSASTTTSASTGYSK